MPTYLENFFKALDLLIKILAAAKRTTRSMINNYVIELIIANNYCVKKYSDLCDEYRSAAEAYNQFDHSVPSKEAAAAYCRYNKASEAKEDGWKFASMSDWIYKEFECIYRNGLDPVTVRFECVTYMDFVHAVYLHGYKISNRQRKTLLDQGVKIYN